MSSFQPLSKERAEEIRRAMASSRATDTGLAFGERGEYVGTAKVNTAPDETRNVIGKFDTHYLR